MTGKISSKKCYYTILVILFFLFVFTRLFRLDSIPFTSTGMHIDEIGAGYNSFCIANYGVDQYLYKFPVYFKSLGEGQNALYIYLAAIIFKFFGVSVFNYRLVAVILAAFAFVALFFLSKQLLGDRYALVSLAMMTIMPVYMMSEHWGLESYLFLSMAIISMSLLIYAIHTNRNVLYILSGIMWGISLYTYAITYVVVPPFLFLTMLYLVFTKKTTIYKMILTGIPVVVLGIPLLIQQLVMLGYIPPFTFLGLIDFWLPAYYRSNDISIRYVVENLIKSPYICLVADDISYNSTPRFGVMYYISVPFVLIGLCLSVKSLILSVKNKKYDDLAVVFIFYFVGRIVTLFLRDPNTNRVNELYLPYLIFAVMGIRYIVKKANKKWMIYMIAALYSVSFLAFCRYFYFNREPSLNYDTRCDVEVFEGYIVYDIHAALAAKEVLEKGNGKKVQMIMDDGDRFWWTTMCLFTGISPYDHNEHVEDTPYYGENFGIGIPEELDLSGNTVYLIQGELSHITDYLVSQGFTNEIAEYGGYSILKKG